MRKIDEQLFFQRSSYDKTGLGYLIGENLANKTKVRKEPNQVVKNPKHKEIEQSRIEPSISTNLSKEVKQLNQRKKCDEPKQIEQVELYKEARQEYGGQCFICNEVGHIKREIV